MVVIGFVDVYYFLHGFGGQVYFVFDDGGAGVQVQVDVDQLDLVGVVDVYIWISLDEWCDCFVCLFGGM